MKKFDRISSTSMPWVGALVLWVVLSPPALAAPKCHIASAASVDFGLYKVYDTMPNNFGVGSISISCQGGGAAIKVTLSAGQSHTFAARSMRSGASQLSYNLYTTAARNMVWGDGGGGSVAVSVNKNTTNHLDIFGQIPALQDVAVGMYNDNIVAVINF